jgi:hypothetical protein
MLKVGTFYDTGPGQPRKSKIRAYRLIYRTDWEGCIEYEIDATNGQQALKLAIERRYVDEMERWERTPRRRVAYGALPLRQMEMVDDIREAGEPKELIRYHQFWIASPRAERVPSRGNLFSEQAVRKLAAAGWLRWKDGCFELVEIDCGCGLP